MSDDLDPFDEPTPMLATRNDAGAAQLIPPAFLRRVLASLNQNPPLPERKLNSQSRGSLAKFWYGLDASIHYEIWVHARTLQLELGLHFESTAEYNQALYRAFDGCMLEIQGQLGASFWLEEWDRGWVRLYETHPLFPLDAYRADEIVDRMCEIISTLQPIYEEIAGGLTAPSLISGANHPRGRTQR
jgi:hypothetical protein